MLNPTYPFSHAMVQINVSFRRGGPPSLGPLIFELFFPFRHVSTIVEAYLAPTAICHQWPETPVQT